LELRSLYLQSKRCTTRATPPVHILTSSTSTVPADAYNWFITVFVCISYFCVPSYSVFIWFSNLRHFYWFSVIKNEGFALFSPTSTLQHTEMCACVCVHMHAYTHTHMIPLFLQILLALIWTGLLFLFYGYNILFFCEYYSKILYFK
jgi:hypothetical protein